MNPRELESHLQDLFEGRLEGEAFENLQEELRSNPEAREVYREYHQLDHALRFRSKGVDLLNVVSMDQVNARRQRRTIRNAGLVAVAMITIGLIAMAFILTRTPDPTLVFSTSPGTEFSISHNLSGEDAPDGQVLEPGSRMIVRSGTVELEFDSGVRAIVRGPADLTLQREDLLDLQNGVVWVIVPEQAIGFQVSTPDFLLTDLGTEFGILSEPNFLDEVHVFGGEVEVNHLNGLKIKELLKQGQARFADAEGRWQKTPLRRDHFLDELPKKKTEPAILVSEESSTQLAYQNDVSDSDLLHGLTASTTGWNFANEATPANLNDGIHGTSYDDFKEVSVKTIAWTTVGATAEYHLGTGKGKGYDLASIQSIADWNGAGFGNQAWTVEVKPVDGEYRILHTVNYHPLTSQPLDGGGATKVILTDQSGVLAKGIESIKFTASHVAGSVANAFVWREIDVFGKASF